MSRKSIFEIVADTFDLSRELVRIKRLFEKETVVYMPYEFDHSVLEYVKSAGFSAWKNRGRCVDADDFLSLLGYKKLWQSAETDELDLFLLLEIVYNFWHIVNHRTHTLYRYDDRGRNFALLKKILDECLAQYNYRGEYFPELEQLIVIEDKPEVTAVAEIVDTEISYKVLRYNHYMLKGDLQAKKDILLALGADLEPKREQIKAIDKNVEDGIFYILNNLNLRHNNTTEGDKHYKQAVADMDEGALEHWYDELYQLMLLAYLQLDQVNRNEQIKNLKRQISPR